MMQSSGISAVSPEALVVLPVVSPASLLLPVLLLLLPVPEPEDELVSPDVLSPLLASLDGSSDVLLESLPTPDPVLAHPASDSETSPINL
ncbi:MAG: hypothetical protein ACE37F_32920 [Nannocystaceae bacterium]|nr:hypothetical protein [bacterium]